MGKKFIMQEHQADIKYILFGKSINEIFQNSASAFSSYISSNKKIKNNLVTSFDLESEDIENLLYLFIDELIYLLDAENFAVSSAKVKVNANKLSAEIYGDNVKNYDLNHVKAATYAEMYVKELKKGEWKAQIVLDV